MRLWNVIKKLLHSIWRAAHCTIIEHDGIEHAGYLAFLGLLALFPFLVLIVVFTGWMGQGEVGTQFIQMMFDHLPPKAVSALRPRIEEIAGGPPPGLVTISILGAIWTSSSAVEGMRTVLNRAYHVSTPPAYWLRRITSIMQLLVFTSVIITGMLLIVFAPIVLEKIEVMLGWHLLPASEFNLSDLIFSFSAFSMFVVVAHLYYILPNIKQTWLDVVVGAAVTVALWTGAAKVISYYLSKFEQVNLIYGSLGGIIATLIFFYVINVIFIFGAELNYQLVTAFGIKVEEKEHVEGKVAEE